MAKKYNYTKKTGRPPKFKKKEEIEEIFKVYSADCEKNGKILSKAGLLYFLHINRTTYNRLKKKKEFSNTIKEIEDLIEDAWIQALHHGKQATGPIFYLKNAFKEEYKDRTETDITSGNKPIPILQNVRFNKRIEKDSGIKKED